MNRYALNNEKINQINKNTLLTVNTAHQDNKSDKIKVNGLIENISSNQNKSTLEGITNNEQRAAKTNHSDFG